MSSPLGPASTIWLYAQESLTRLTGGDNWGDIIGIPALDKDELPTYFLAYGTEEEISDIYNFADQNSWDGLTYGIPSTGNAQGIVYNKAVFEKAGITELPKTPDEFIAALQKIKDICAVPEAGTVYHGKVTSIQDFGAFVEILPGKEGLLHVSEIAWTKTENVSDVLKVGDEVDVKLLEIDQKTGKMRLSMRALTEKPEGYVEPKRNGGPRQNGDRRQGGDRREGGRNGDRREGRQNGERRDNNRQNGERRHDNRNNEHRENRRPRQEEAPEQNNEPDFF